MNLLDRLFGLLLVTLMKTIAWDIDDVLNDLMGQWFAKHWLPAHPDCPIAYGQLTENPPHRLLGVDLSEYLASLDSFRRSQAAELLPLPGVLQWFRRHGHRCRHLALTAVPLFAAGISAAWVMRHFGEWIRSFNFVPSQRPGETWPRYDQDKKEFLHWWGKPLILIDDNPENIKSATEAGVQPLLMPRPWNHSTLTEAETLEHLTALCES